MADENKKIDKLTPEQQAMLPWYREQGMLVRGNTDPTDRPVVIEAMRDLYKHLERDPIDVFIFVKNEFDAQLIVNDLTVNDPDDAKINSWTLATNDEWVENILANLSNLDQFTNIETHKYGTGKNEIDWVNFYKFFRDECGIVYNETANRGLDIFDRLAHSSGTHYMYNKCAIICDR